jgi:hypothetical protein
VDEAALFAAVEEMRAAEREATRLTRSARRDRARRHAARIEPAPAIVTTKPVGPPDEAPPPFDDIEQW